MKTYTATFIGRKVGATGKTYCITTETHGDTPEAAELALYDRFEHISSLAMIPNPAEEPEHHAHPE
jgi:hypothetical protein